MDGELKRVCEQLIADTVRTVTDAMAAFLARVRDQQKEAAHNVRRDPCS